ncbi:hypothetical protein AB0425_16660 [Actinosynnema sp. NPDC051121]|nr:hypothetical protein [Saccharothrix sp.]
MTQDTTEAAVAVAASLVLPIAIGAAAGWPVWVIVIAAAALPAAAIVAVKERRRRRKQWELRVEHERYDARHTAPPTPVAPPGRPLASISLPSALPDYRFTFACTVHWQPHPHAAGHAEPGAVAADAVVQRALRLAAGRRPDDEGAVHALAAALGQRENDPGQHVVAWATDVRLELAQDDRDRLRRVADMRKQQQVWEQEVAAERAVRAYLGQDVLTSTGSTVVWWLARNTGQVREAVDLIGTLARLSAAAGNREVDEVFRGHLLGGAATSPFIVNGHATAGDVPPRGDDDVLLDPDDHPVFGHQLADLLEQHDAPDSARRVRERYGVEDWKSGEASESSEDDG